VPPPDTPITPGRKSVSLAPEDGDDRKKSFSIFTGSSENLLEKLKEHNQNAQVTSYKGHIGAADCPAYVFVLSYDVFIVIGKVK